MGVGYSTLRPAAARGAAHDPHNKPRPSPPARPHVVHPADESAGYEVPTGPSRLDPSAGDSASPAAIGEDDEGLGIKSMARILRHTVGGTPSVTIKGGPLGRFRTSQSSVSSPGSVYVWGQAFSWPYPTVP
jgi:hypothetical protein